MHVSSPVDRRLLYFLSAYSRSHMHGHFLGMCLFPTSPLPFSLPSPPQIRGPQIMLGYLNNDKATKETLTPDGWLRTGDVCVIDEDGYIQIVDRCKELIKYKGE